MKVDSLRLKQFSVFEDVELTFSPGINVFLGTNGTGKSHAMKALYAVLKAAEEKTAEEKASEQGQLEPESERRLAYFRKLVNVFKPDRGDAARLLHRGATGPAEIAMTAGGHRFQFLIRGGGGVSVTEAHGSHAPDTRALFLPPRELLSMFEGFLAAYKSRELSFDETYYDACFALSASALRGDRYEESAPLRAPIEAAIGGPVVLEGNRFWVRRADGLMEPHLLADGWRRLAGIAYLIANGSLSAGTTFFWDEPEAGLNPPIVAGVVVDLLLALAARGVQIFLATHDYLLSRKLSLLSEYGKSPAAPIRFFGFQRSAGAEAVSVMAGPTVAALPEDPILDEFVRHYDFARGLFHGADGSS